MRLCGKPRREPVKDWCVTEPGELRTSYLTSNVRRPSCTDKVLSRSTHRGMSAKHYRHHNPSLASGLPQRTPAGLAKKLRPGFGGSLGAREPVWDGEGWGCDRVAGS